MFYIIVDYFDRTIQPVIEDLGENPSPKDWHAWISKWSTFSVEDFLRSDTHQVEDGEQLRPWPETAITAYKVSVYNSLKSTTSFQTTLHTTSLNMATSLKTSS